MAPRGPPIAGPTLALDTAKYRGPSVISPDKRANILCSPLMSPAKRTGSTLGPLGFIYPFFLALQRVDGRQVGQVPHLWPSDHITHTHTWPFTFPKSFTLHSRCRFSYSLFATEALCLRTISGRNEPASVQLKGFLKETFTRECSLTSTRVIEAERTALLIESQDGNSSGAGDLEFYLQNRGERGE